MEARVLLKPLTANC